MDSIWHHYGGFGTPIAGDTIALYLLNGSPDPEQATTVTLLYNFTDSNYLNDNTWKVDTNIVVPVAQGQSYIALRYRTTNNWLDVRFDDITIIGHNATSVEEPLINKVKIFPNPAIDYLNLEISDEINVSNIQIQDMTGKIFSVPDLNMNSISIGDLSSGSYLLKIITSQGMVTRKFLKN